MPLLAFRLAAPSLLVDIRKIAGLDRISIGDDGITLGARVRWRDIEDEPRLRAAHPLLVASVGHVAHYQIRNRGTVGGSLAHADSAAELPGIAVTCDAVITTAGPTGTRRIPAADFFLRPLTTILASDEIITEIRLPTWPAGRRWGFEEFARRRGDFALAGIAAFWDEDEGERVRNAHLGVIGACRRAHRLGVAEAILNGRPSMRQQSAKRRAPLPRRSSRRKIFTRAPPIGVLSSPPCPSARSSALLHKDWPLNARDFQSQWHSGEG